MYITKRETRTYGDLRTYGDPPIQKDMHQTMVFHLLTIGAALQLVYTASGIGGSTLRELEL